MGFRINRDKSDTSSCKRAFVWLDRNPQLLWKSLPISDIWWVHWQPMRRYWWALYHRSDELLFGCSRANLVQQLASWTNDGNLSRHGWGPKLRANHGYHELILWQSRWLYILWRQSLLHSLNFGEWNSFIQWLGNRLLWLICSLYHNNCLCFTIQWRGHVWCGPSRGLCGKHTQWNLYYRVVQSRYRLRSASKRYHKYSPKHLLLCSFGFKPCHTSGNRILRVHFHKHNRQRRR